MPHSSRLPPPAPSERERNIHEAATRLLASIVDFSSDAIISKDLSGVVTSWNKGAERMLGYSAEEMIGQSITRIIPSARLHEEAHILGKIERGELVEHFETERLNKDGRLIAVAVTISPIRDARGAIVGASKVARDVSQRQDLAAGLRQARDTLALLIEQAPVSIAMFDREMRYMAVSRRWLHDFGDSNGTLLGRSHYDVHTDLPEHWHAAHRSALQGQVVKEEDDEWVKRDGSSQWLRWTVHPWKDTSGGIGGIIIFAEDITGRKRAEQLLRETEQRFHRMFDHMLEGCQIIGFDWRYRYVNPSMAAQSRMQRENLLGRTIMEVFPGTEHTRLFAALKNCMENRVPSRLEQRFEYLDGGEAWFDLSTQPSSEGIFVLSIDITERKRAETTLSESEERYRHIIETANEGVWQVDPSLNTLFVNARMAEILGCSPEEMIGKSALEFVDEAALAASAGRSEQRRRGIREEYVLRMFRKDGGEVWLLINSNPVFDVAGCYMGTLAMITDITDRKRVEALLHASDERFRQLAESLPQLIWTCDAQGECDFLSKQWADYTGVPVELLLGSRWLERVHPDDRLAMNEVWLASLKSGVEFHCEFRIQRHDGQFRWFDSRATPQCNAQGRIMRWYGASMDIEAERRARDMQSRNQKIEALGTLAGGIAHDFNNILLAITGNTTLALEDLESEHPVRQSLVEIERASRRATDLVRRILAFSRQEEQQRKVVSLQPVMEEALKLLRATVPAQIEFHPHFVAATPRTVCDATQVHQILMNLITNAAYAIGDRAGSIEIALEPSQIDETLSRPDLRAGRYARLTVADTGCGMEKSTIERIFDPFFTTKPAGQGTGLGLSVVDGIMKAHGGAVTVYSEPGQGTVFRLYFPATAEEESAPSPAVSASFAGRGQRVLYIDDDELLVSLGVRKLTRLGYDVTGESDPEAALARFLADPGYFDVVITDLSMPRLPGFELVRRLRAVRPDLPVIVTSGYIRPRDQETARQVGVREIVLKPNTADDMGRVLYETFGHQPLS